MSVEIIQERLATYGCASAQEEEQALREISQEIILAALGRTDFFNDAGFQGGTCLRIFHGLNRFSEDLDFALRIPDSHFQLTPYLQQVRDELVAYGYTARHTPVNHALLSAALNQQGTWAGKTPSTDNTWCIAALTAVIETVDWRKATQDVERFLKPIELPSLALWSREFFLAQCHKL